MTKISAPISIAGVAAALRLQAHDAQRRGIGYLCGNTHGRIATWARYKPVRHPSIEPLTSEQWREANHGLIPPEGAVAGHPSDAAWRNRVCTYAGPRGGESEPFRLSDFDGYDTTAAAPVATPGTLYAGPTDAAGSLSFNFGAGLSTVAGASTLSLSDFAALDNYYPCVAVFFDVDGTTYTRIITAPLTFANGGSRVSLPVAALRSTGAREFTYFMCGCSAPQTSLGIAPAASYIVLPSDSPLTDSISLSDTLPLRLRFLRVRQGGLGSGTFFAGFDVADYNPVGSIIINPGGDLVIGGEGDATGGAQYRYFNVGSTATVSFRISLQNYGASDIRIPATALYCEVRNNLAGATPPIARAAVVRAMDGSTMRPAVELKVPAGETIECAVAWPDYCCVRNASGGIVSLGDTKRFNASFRLLLNSNSPTTLGSTGLNIANYNVINS